MIDSNRAHFQDERSADSTLTFLNTNAASEMKDFIMLTHLNNLLCHAAWADAVFVHAWSKSPSRDHEEMRQRVGHIVGVQGGFLAVLQGNPPGGPPSGPPSSFDELKSRLEKTHSGFKAYLQTLDDAAQLRTVQIPWFPDPPCIITVAEAIVQVAMHTQHHRGQCMTRLKDHGGEPKNVDWIIWLWKGKPVPKWD